MSEISPQTLDRFEGVTSLCHCWRIEDRTSQRRVFITDHDRPVDFQGETHQPGLALERSNIRHTLSMAPEPLDLSGALDVDGLTADDLRAGVWDGARVTIWRVDWQQAEHFVWLWSGYLTGIEEEGGRFSVRLASLKSGLERTTGRVFGRQCDADLGDARCGVDLGSAPQSACNKRFATCRDVFGNAENFRGFPHMPGNDAIISGPGDKRDGSSRGIER